MPYVSQADKDKIDRMNMGGGNAAGLGQWIPLIMAMLLLPAISDDNTATDAATTAMDGLQATSSGNVNSNVDSVIANFKATLKTRRVKNKREALGILIGAAFTAFAGGGLGFGGGNGGGAVLLILGIVLLSSNSTSGGLLGGIL